MPSNHATLPPPRSLREAHDYLIRHRRVCLTILGVACAAEYITTTRRRGVALLQFRRTATHTIVELPVAGRYGSGEIGIMWDLTGFAVEWEQPGKEPFEGVVEYILEARQS
jgi:hypothetical protein